MHCRDLPLKSRRWICLRVAFALTTIALAAFTSRAGAEDYPSRPITIVVPFPAGAATDLVARILASHLQTSLGQPVRIENVSGASGTIGIEKVVRAAPDGYTALVGNWSSNVGPPAIFPISYDVFRDLQPVARLSDVPLMLIGRKGLPATNLAELIDWLHAHRDTATMATIGTATAADVCALDLQRKFNTPLQLVPYRGGAPAVQAILGGEVDIMCGEASGMLPHIRARSVLAFAVMEGTRWFAAPEIPTLAEAGQPSLDLPVWSGLWLPANSSPAIVTRLADAVRLAFSDAAVREKLHDIGQQLPPLDQQSPEGLAAYYKASTDRWWPVIRAAQGHRQ